MSKEPFSKPVARNPSALRVLLEVKPWRSVPRWTIALIAVGFVAGITAFALVYSTTRSLQWGVLLTLPTIIVSLSGGIVYGMIGTLAVTLVPFIEQIALGMPVGGNFPMFIVATLVFLIFSAVVGYVAALSVSFSAALREVRKLKAILPICAHCKRVRDDNGYWREVEEYISSHSEIEFSHGFCDECLEELYPQVAEKRRRLLREG
jgi:hypothetical protein